MTSTLFNVVLSVDRGRITKQLQDINSMWGRCDTLRKQMAAHSLAISSAQIKLVFTETLFFVMTSMKTSCCATVWLLVLVVVFFPKS